MTPVKTTELKKLQKNENENENEKNLQLGVFTIVIYSSLKRLFTVY
jgi:hypothetical protein